MMSHVHAARRAAALTLWAASGGAPLKEATELMRLIVEIWPGDPPLLGSDTFADTPSASAWKRAQDELAIAKDTHAITLNTNWEQRAEAERLIAEFVAGQRAERGAQ